MDQCRCPCLFSGQPSSFPLWGRENKNTRKGIAGDDC
jgi:hypothetical protein